MLLLIQQKEVRIKEKGEIEMTKYEMIYNAEVNTYDNTWKVFTAKEIESLKKDAQNEEDLFFLAVDYNCTITVVKYILKNL